MSQAQLPNELATFLENWTTDPNNAKDAFVRFKDFLLTTPDVRFDFKARPGVSYSLRAANAKNDERPLFVLVDVVDDEPEARWLSVCFYADMVNDPDELGDFVPSGLMGKDACCLNLEEDDPAMRDYILARLGALEVLVDQLGSLLLGLGFLLCPRGQIVFLPVQCHCPAPPYSKAPLTASM